MLYPMLSLIISGCATVTSSTCIQPGDLVDVEIPAAPPREARSNARLAEDFVALQSEVLVDNQRKEKLRKVLAACRGG